MNEIARILGVSTPNTITVLAWPVQQSFGNGHPVTFAELEAYTAALTYRSDYHDYAWNTPAVELRLPEPIDGMPWCTCVEYYFGAGVWVPRYNIDRLRASYVNKSVGKIPYREVEIDHPLVWRSPTKT